MNSILLGTGSFSNLEEGNIVSISTMETEYPTFFKLVPKGRSYREAIEELKRIKEEVIYLASVKKMEDELISNYYHQVLKKLYIIGLMKEMKNRFGEGIIFASEEMPDEFNYRRIFADYIELETGVYVPEVSTIQGKVKKMVPTRYKKRLRKIIDS